MAIKISDKRYEEIKNIVVNMFKEYGVSCVPISGFEIAQKMGIKVIPYCSFTEAKRQLLLKESEDGFSVLKKNGQWFIYYNDQKGYGRINNTIMHEIGHIVLDHTEDSELAEKEVKFFAKYALTPPALIHKLKLTSADEIADIFEVSKEAAEYAYLYYLKWKRYSFRAKQYTNYEVAMLELFSLVS